MHFNSQVTYRGIRKVLKLLEIYKRSSYILNYRRVKEKRLENKRGNIQEKVNRLILFFP